MCKVNQMFQSKRPDARKATVIAVGEKITVKHEDGEVKDLSESYLKRWYKKLDEVAVGDAEVPNNENPTPAPENPTPENPTPDPTPENENPQPENPNPTPENNNPAPKPDNKAVLQPLFDKLLEAGKSWEGVEVKKTSAYTSLKANKLFAEIHLSAKQLVVYILPVVDETQEGIEVKRVPEKFKWTLDTGLYIKDEASLAKAIELMAVSYDYRKNNKKVERKAKTV